MRALQPAPVVALTLMSTTLYSQNTPVAANVYVQLMTKAAAHAEAHGGKIKPALSPVDATVLSGSVPMEELRRDGFRVVPWTTNEPEKMRSIIRMNVDGLITDRPDLLQQVLAEERASSPERATQLKTFNVSGHRGARGLRPENTLPAFEAGLDNLIDVIETDTGVTSDKISLIWHDQFLNPQSCRKANGSPYSMENRVYVRDISVADAQATFICDKLHFGLNQKNDLVLSPVSVAFAQREHLISPYVPTYLGQLFRFVVFYAGYYREGAGRLAPHAKERADAADRVHFNLETKILPENLASQAKGITDPKVPAEMLENRTVAPQVFVDTLCGTIRKYKMESRSDVQSFDFRTLILVQEHYPEIATYYLTEDPAMLATEFVPASLRVVH